MYTSMSRLVNLSDSVYEELTRRKKARGESYSGVIAGLLEPRQKAKKKETLQDLIAWAEKRARACRGRKEHTDHDLVAYGVSRDGT